MLPPIALATLASVVDLIVAALLLAGVGLNLIAAVGLHRFPDLFCRMHAATKPATLGLLCVLGAAALATGDIAAVAKLLLVAALQLATNPVGGHMVGRAAWQVGVPTHPGTRVEPAPPETTTAGTTTAETATAGMTTTGTATAG